MKLKEHLITIGIEKSFDSLNHIFGISTLEKNGFGKPL